MTNFTLGKDINGNVTYSAPFSDLTYHATLAANTPASLTVPQGYKVALISLTPGSSVFIGPEAITETAPGSFTQTTAQLNPSVRNLDGISTLHFYALEITVVSISFYKE